MWLFSKVTKDLSYPVTRVGEEVDRQWSRPLMISVSWSSHEFLRRYGGSQDRPLHRQCGNTYIGTKPEGVNLGSDTVSLSHTFFTDYQVYPVLGKLIDNQCFNGGVQVGSLERETERWDNGDERV